MYLYVEQKFRQIISLAVQKLILLIDKDNQPKKKHVFPKLPQCKWKKRYEQRIKRELQESKHNLSARLVPMKISEQENRQIENVLKQMRMDVPLEQCNNLQNNVLTTQQQFKQSIALKINKFCSNFQYCSFLFSNAVKITKPKYLKSRIFTTIHNIIINNYQPSLLKQNNFQQSISILNNSIEFITSPSCNFGFHSQNEKQLFIKDMQAAVMKAQRQSQQNETAIKMMRQVENKITKLKLEYIQQILHDLQIAKIYRYKYSLKIEQLLGQYVMNKVFVQRQFVVEPAGDFPHIIGTTLQLSDMGLISRLENIDSQQQNEIYTYWNQKRKTLKVQHNLHQVSYYTDSLIKFDHIFKEDLINEYETTQSNRKMIVKQYLQFLDKLQQRLLQEDLNFQQYYKNTFEDLVNTQKQRQNKFSACSPSIQETLTIKIPAKTSYHYYNNNLLRMCCKWIKFQNCDGLEAAQMIAKLQLQQITYVEILSRLKQDYIEEVVIPNFLLIKQLIQLKELNLDFIAMIDKQLENQQEEKKRINNPSQKILTPPTRPIARNTPPVKKKNKNKLQDNIELISISSSQTSSCQNRSIASSNVKLSDFQIGKQGCGENNKEKDESISLSNLSCDLEESVDSLYQVSCSSSSSKQVPRKPIKRVKITKQSIDID